MTSAPALISVQWCGGAPRRLDICKRSESPEKSPSPSIYFLSNGSVLSRPVVFTVCPNILVRGIASRTSSVATSVSGLLFQHLRCGDLSKLGDLPPTRRRWRPVAVHARRRCVPGWVWSTTAIPSVASKPWEWRTATSSATTRHAGDVGSLRDNLKCFQESAIP